MENRLLSDTLATTAEAAAHMWFRRAGKGFQIPLGLSHSVSALAG